MAKHIKKLMTFAMLSEAEQEHARALAVKIAEAAESVNVRLEKTKNTDRNLDVTPALAMATWILQQYIL